MVNPPTNPIFCLSHGTILFAAPRPSSTIFCAKIPNFYIFMQVLAILAKNIPYQPTQLGNSNVISNESDPSIFCYFKKVTLVNWGKHTHFTVKALLKHQTREILIAVRKINPYICLTF